MVAKFEHMASRYNLPFELGESRSRSATRCT